MLNTELLKKKIEESGLKIKFIIYTLDISNATWSKILSHESDLKRQHIQKLQQMLRLTDEEVMAIFFEEE